MDRRISPFHYEAGGIARAAGAIAADARNARAPCHATSGGARWRAIAALVLSAGIIGIFCREPAGGGSMGDPSARDGWRRSEMTKTTIGVTTGVVAAAIAVGSASTASGQEAVQWRVENGGNGHWYSWSQWAAPESWQSASARSETMGAHLTTLTSAAEEAFVRTLAPRGSCVPAPGSEAAIGLRQDRAANEPAGGWAWVTGEPFIHQNWRSGEPNDFNGGEDAGFLNLGAGWNDGAEGQRFECWQSAIIEWSADCNGDGIVDYGQIRAGELDDADGDNVPDCCDKGASCSECAADVVDDGVVNAVDLAAVLSAWGTDGGALPRSDVDGSGEVDALDLAQVLSDWGSCR